MAQILSFPCVIWLVFPRIFANKRIHVPLVLVLKVKQPWKGNATVKLEPQIATFLVNHPKRCQNFVLTQQKPDFKSILPHTILPSEGQKLTHWGGFFLHVFLVFLPFTTAQTASTCDIYSPIRKGTLAFAATCAL